jgi:hypothetical protein
MHVSSDSKRCGIYRAVEGYGAGQRQEMSLAEYASWWRRHKAGEPDAQQLLYLKDWHFASEFPSHQVLLRHLHA